MVATTEATPRMALRVSLDMELSGESKSSSLCLRDLLSFFAICLANYITWLIHSFGALFQSLVYCMLVFDCPILNVLDIKDIRWNNGQIIKDMYTDNKKTEKLASALYLLTSFFEEREPMKWRLRELAARLVSQKESKNAVLEIMGLLNVAKNAGLVSDTNFDIMHKQFALIAPEPIEEMFKLEAAEVPRALVPVEPTPEKSEKPSLYVSSSVPAPVHHAPVIKDRIQKESIKDGVVAMKKNGRQSIILGLLKKKREIMIKDVVPLIDGVSEKTIQRELLAMVSSGILKKEGEKRWSRYTLAQ
jgi:hypothetical protein